MSHATIDSIQDIISMSPMPKAPAGDIAWQKWADACVDAVNAKGIDANVRYNDDVLNICAANMDTALLYPDEF